MAVINGTIAFFNAVQSAIEYLREMLEIVDQYVSTIASVARGDVAPGRRDARTRAGQRRARRDRVPGQPGGPRQRAREDAEIIVGLRELVDQALDWLFDQAMALGRAALDALTGGPAAAPEAAHQRPLPAATSSPSTRW